MADASISAALNDVRGAGGDVEYLFRQGISDDRWKDVVIYAVTPIVLIVLFSALISYTLRGYTSVTVAPGNSNPTCQGTFEKMSDPYPNAQGFCYNYSQCYKVASSKNESRNDHAFSVSDLTGMTDWEQFKIQNTAICRTIEDLVPVSLDDGSGVTLESLRQAVLEKYPDETTGVADICCINGFTTCYPVQLRLLANGFTTTAGMVREFNPFIVQHSPIGFAQNPDTPYLTFPVFDFGMKPWLLGDNDCTDQSGEVFDLAAGGLSDNVAGLAMAPLGLLTLLRNQAVVITLVTPPGEFDPATGLPTGCTYFSMTPNIGIIGDPEGSDMYQSGISFSSIGYSLNLYDIQREFFRKGDSNTSPYSRRISVIYSFNRSLAERAYRALSVDDSIELVTCLPIPAATTFGEARDMYGKSFLLSDRSNTYLTRNSLLVDPDIHLMVSPIMRAAGSSTELTDWYTNATDNRTITVVGATDNTGNTGNTGDALFSLKDMNGHFDESGTWVGGHVTSAENPNITPTSWKRQLPAFTPEAALAENLETVYQTLKTDLEQAGYDKVWEVGVYRGTFPKWGLDRAWNQNGFETRNYGIQAEGDCPDTYYPVSQNVCVGPNQIAVAIAVNHTLLGNSCYNTVAWYDSASVTSIGSTVSNDNPSPIDDKVIISAVSRSDYRCEAPSALLNGRIQFCTTGMHNEVLGSPPTVPILTMERMYCNPYVLVPTTALDADDSVTADDRLRGSPDNDYDRTDLGSLDSLTIPPGTVLRHSSKYPQYAAPQSIKTTSALPFRVFVFSKSSGPPPTVASCVDISDCQSATDGTDMASYTCVDNPEDGQTCPNDGTVAAREVTRKKDTQKYIRSRLLLNGNHKESYTTTGFVYLALSIMGIVATLIALMAGIFLNTKNDTPTVPRRWRYSSYFLYLIAAGLAVTALTLSILRLQTAEDQTQFDLYNGYNQYQAKIKRVK